MPPRRKKSEITDQMILEYDNVPVNLAASYLCTGADALARMLRRGLNPIGAAVMSSESDSWTYLIPAERLVKYKHGEMPVLDVPGLAEDIDKRLDRALRRIPGYHPDV